MKLTKSVMPLIMACAFLAGPQSISATEDDQAAPATADQTVSPIKRMRIQTTENVVKTKTATDRAFTRRRF